jgi:hypothetical protein
MSLLAEYAWGPDKSGDRSENEADKVARAIRNRVGKQLRDHYAGVLREAMPARLSALLENLEAREFAAG